MNNSLYATVVCIAGDPVRRSWIAQALRDAGFTVAEAANEEAAAVVAPDRPALVFRDGTRPAFLIASSPAAGSGDAYASSQIELALPPAAAEPAAFGNIAHALWNLLDAGVLFQFGAADTNAAPTARQIPAPNAAPLDRLCHDLRTPLSAMLGRLFLMQSGKLDEADMKRSIEKLQGNIKEQVQLIDRLHSEATAEPVEESRN
jgi:signal transduction histidine kinase